MTGSIACYKACQVISRLVQNDCDVQVVATPAALNFIGNATLEGLTGKPVVSDTFAVGSIMDHIHLMRWADLILVAPATANFINKAAQGIGDDLVHTLFLAHDFKKPFLIAPAMNSSMYNHPVTQKSIQALKAMGLEILDTASGMLACGEEGLGKLLDPELIIEAIKNKLDENITANNGASAVKVISPMNFDVKKSTLSNIKVLITAGGTQEPLDTVRVISNLSSGRTGIAIAEFMTDMGFDVTLLAAHGSPKTTAVTHRDTFTSFSSLDEKIKKYLSSESFTHVIHAAAVSDYSVGSIEVQGKKYLPLELKKVSSDVEDMSIHLKRNPKIVDNLKIYSMNKRIQIIAFKLTSHATEAEKQEAVSKLFEHSHADLVVQNDLTDIDVVNKKHKFRLYTSQSFKVYDNLEKLAGKLIYEMIPKDSL